MGIFKVGRPRVSWHNRPVLRWRSAHHAHTRIEAARAALRANSFGQRRLVAPSKAAASEVLRGDTYLQASVGIRRETLYGIALDLAAASLATRGWAPITPLVRESLAAQAIERAELDHWRPIARTPGLPKAVAKTVRDLRRFGMTPEDLKRIKAPTDVVSVLEAYEALLEDTQVADEAAVFRLAETSLATVPPMPMVLLDVVPQDPVEAAFAVRLVRTSSAVLFTSPRPEVLKRWSGLGHTPEPLTEISSEHPPRQFEIFAAANEADEASKIAQNIHRLAGHGIPFDRMAVFLRNPKRVQPLKAAFVRAEIPAIYARATQTPDPSGRALLALLACAAEGLSAERFAEYLSLGEVPPWKERNEPAPGARQVPWVAAKDERQLSFFSVEPELEASSVPAEQESDEAPVVDGRLVRPYRWEQVLVEASVVGGASRWRRRLSGYAEELLDKAKQSKTEAPERSAAFERERVSVLSLMQFSLPLIQALDQLPKEASWATWLSHLEAIAARALRAPDRVLRLLAELRGVQGTLRVSLDVVRRALHERLAYLQEEPDDEQPYGKVFVAPVESALGRSFEVVMVPGLSQGRFPKTPTEDPLLSDSVRGTLNEDKAFSFLALPEASKRERAYLQQLIEACETHFVASFPLADGEQERVVVPSLYALELYRLSKGHFPSMADLKPSTLSAAEEAVDKRSFDLTLALCEGSVAGAGRYLMEREDGTGKHLPRSLRAQWSRWQEEIREHDGYVDTPGSLKAHRLQNRAYSATALQRFSHCPYQFFLGSIVRLREREGPEQIERMDPLIRGSLVHEVLFRWTQSKLQGESTLDEQLKTLQQTMEQVSQAYFDRHYPALPSLWWREVRQLERELCVFIRKEAAELVSYRPLHAELGFGLAPSKGQDPASVETPLNIEGGFQIRGSIDLVEESQTGHLRITDYKTGRLKLVSEAAVEGGKTLQPGLYSAAASSLCQKPVDRSRLVYCTERGQYRSVYYQVGPQGQRMVQDALSMIDTAVENSLLPAMPDRNACRFCDYRPACSTDEEVRIQAKDPSVKRSLARLRGLP